MKKRNAWLALLIALGLIAASCGSDSDDDTEAGGTADDATEESDDAAESDESDEATDESDESDEAMEEGDGAMPGAGVAVTMGKADWTTEDPNAYVIHNLMEELGYEVTDPADLELGPSNAYLAMAQGDMDFWINGWYPGHNSWHENELPDGSLVGDHVSVTGEMMLAGGLQGYLITKSFAEEYGITSLDDFNSNAEAIAAYDAQDPSPDNGVADIYGCQESWTCDDIITAQIAFSGWENINQTIAGYDAMVAEAITKANAGEPAIVYTWTPSAYITELRPGDNVLWLEVENVVDDSNPTGVEGGEEYDQRPGIAGIGPESCPGSDGECQMGWVAADIQATGNNDWLAANPAAAKLLELFEMNVLEVSLLNVEMDDGTPAADLAARWIEENREKADGWIAEAVAAG